MLEYLALLTKCRLARLFQNTQTTKKTIKCEIYYRLIDTNLNCLMNYLRFNLNTSLATLYNLCEAINDALLYKIYIRVFIHYTCLFLCNYPILVDLTTPRKDHSSAV